jgi:hypothetical protein
MAADVLALSEGHREHPGLPIMQALAAAVGNQL